MQDNPNSNQDNIDSAPEPELKLSEMQKKCLDYFNELSVEDKNALDQKLNIEGAPSVDNFHVTLEIEEDIEKLNNFLKLLARYKFCKTVSGEEAKQEAEKALKDITKLF